MRTVQQPQPDDPIPNTAESMVKNVHRTPIVLIHGKLVSYSQIVLDRHQPIFLLGNPSQNQMQIVVRLRTDQSSQCHD
jgi:hypothetical protein